MSTTRSATLALLGGALSASLVTGTAGSASAKDLWCEEAVAYGCSRWADSVRDSGADTLRSRMSLGEYAKLQTLRRG